MSGRGVSPFRYTRVLTTVFVFFALLSKTQKGVSHLQRRIRVHGDSEPTSAVFKPDFPRVNLKTPITFLSRAKDASHVLVEINAHFVSLPSAAAAHATEVNPSIKEQPVSAQRSTSPLALPNSRPTSVSSENSNDPSNSYENEDANQKSQPPQGPLAEEDSTHDDNVANDSMLQLDKDAFLQSNHLETGDLVKNDAKDEESSDANTSGLLEPSNDSQLSPSAPEGLPEASLSANAHTPFNNPLTAATADTETDVTPQEESHKKKPTTASSDTTYDAELANLFGDTPSEAGITNSSNDTGVEAEIANSSSDNALKTNLANSSNDTVSDPEVANSSKDITSEAEVANPSNDITSEAEVPTSSSSNEEEAYTEPEVSSEALFRNNTSQPKTSHDKVSHETDSDQKVPEVSTNSVPESKEVYRVPRDTSSLHNSIETKASNKLPSEYIIPGVSSSLSSMPKTQIAPSILPTTSKNIDTNASSDETLHDENPANQNVYTDSALVENALTKNSTTKVPQTTTSAIQELGIKASDVQALPTQTALQGFPPSHANMSNIVSPDESVSLNPSLVSAPILPSPTIPASDQEAPLNSQILPTEQQNALASPISFNNHTYLPLPNTSRPLMTKLLTKYPSLSQGWSEALKRKPCVSVIGEYKNQTAHRGAVGNHWISAFESLMQSVLGPLHKDADKNAEAALTTLDIACRHATHISFPLLNRLATCAVDGVNGRTMLMHIVHIGFLQSLKHKTLWNIFNPKAFNRLITSVDKDGNNLLHIAVLSRSNTIVREVIFRLEQSLTTRQLQAFFDTPNIHGLKPLDFARQMSVPAEILKTLMTMYRALYHETSHRVGQEGATSSS